MLWDFRKSHSYFQKADPEKSSSLWTGFEEWLRLTSENEVGRGFWDKSVWPKMHSWRAELMIPCGRGLVLRSKKWKRRLER